MDVTKSYKFKWFGDAHGPSPCELYMVSAMIVFVSHALASHASAGPTAYPGAEQVLWH